MTEPARHMYTSTVTFATGEVDDEFHARIRAPGALAQGRPGGHCAARPLLWHAELEKIAEYFEGPADESGLGFEVKASGVAFVNAALCRRAINNLVVNAVRHGALGTIGAQDGDTATIVVENEGAPAPPEQLGRLFDRFYHGNAHAATLSPTASGSQSRRSWRCTAARCALHALCPA